jgi:precorrin-4 methylase
LSGSFELPAAHRVAQGPPAQRQRPPAQRTPGHRGEQQQPGDRTVANPPVRPDGRGGIPCSVIPGLSCVTSAPTLAGIPLTHRGVAQSFTVVSGHLRPDDPNSTVDWAGLAASAETLVLLTAVGNLPAIAACLLHNGRPPGTSVACIQHAATPRHRFLRCTLAELAAAGTDLKVETRQ